MSRSPALIPSSWSAGFFDGETPERHVAMVMLGPNSLGIHLADGRQLWWPYREIRLAQGRFPGEEVRLEHGTGLPEILVIADKRFLYALRQVAPSFGRGFLAPAQGMNGIFQAVAAALAGIGIVAGTFVWGLPRMTDVLTPLIPVAFEDWLGEQAFLQLAGEERLVRDPRILAPLQEIVARLEAGGEHPYSFRLYVVKDDSVNAFALPGGRILVNSGLLAKMQRPEEMAGVLSHEMIHVLHRHSTRTLLREVSARVMLSAALGGTDQLAGLLGNAVSLGMLHVSREAETEADVAGLRLMLRSRIDPGGMVGCLRVLDQAGGAQPRMLAMLSDHPETRDRLARIEALASEAKGPYRPLLPGVNWMDVREAAQIVD